MISSTKSALALFLIWIQGLLVEVVELIAFCKPGDAIRYWKYGKECLLNNPVLVHYDQLKSLESRSYFGALL